MKHVIIATPDELKQLSALAEYVMEAEQDHYDETVASNEDYEESEQFDVSNHPYLLAQTLARLIKQASLK